VPSQLPTPYSLVRQLPAQERGRLAEVALDRADRHAQLPGDLLDGVAAEEAQLDDLALPLVQAGQAGQGLVDGQQVQALLGEVVQHVVQRQPLAVAAALVGGAAAGVIDQHLAHGAGGGRQELAAALGGAQGVGAEEAQDGLVDQGGRLQRVAGPLAAQQAAAQPPQLVVDQGDQLVAGAGAAGPDLLQEGRHLALAVGLHDGFPRRTER
jgi:hypothetical protein